jgi:hypothetical protein
MSAAFMMFILWLSLAGVAGLVPSRRRPLAKLGLFAFAPVLLIVTLLTQGWLPSLIVIATTLTVFPAEIARIRTILRELAGGGLGQEGPADHGRTA